MISFQMVKKSKNERQNGPRERKSTTRLGQVSGFVGSGPLGGHARDKKSDIGLWKMDKRQMERGKVASKRQEASEMI